MAIKMTVDNFKPRGHGLLVEVLFEPVSSTIFTIGEEEIDQTEMGMILKGRVIRTGPGIPNEKGNLLPPLSKEGDIVVFSPASVMPLLEMDKNTDKHYVLLDDGEVMATIIQ